MKSTTQLRLHTTLFLALLFSLSIDVHAGSLRTHFEQPIPTGWNGLGMQLIPKAVEVVELADKSHTYFWLLESPSVGSAQHKYFYAYGTPESGMKLILTDVMFGNDLAKDEAVYLESFKSIEGKKHFVMRKGDLFGYSFPTKNKPGETLTFAFTHQGSKGQNNAYRVSKALAPSWGESRRLKEYRALIDAVQFSARNQSLNADAVYAHLETAFYPLEGGYVIYRILEHPFYPNQFLVITAPVTSSALNSNLPYLLTEVYEGNSEKGWTRAVSSDWHGSTGKSVTRFKLALEGEFRRMQYETTHELYKNVEQWTMDSKVIKEAPGLVRHQIKESLEKTLRQNVFEYLDHVSIEPGLITPLSVFPKVEFDACHFMLAPKENGDELFN